MYESTYWKDHAVSPSNRYRVTNNGDGTVTAERAGTVIQQGTSMSATNFNNIENGILDAHVSVGLLANLIRQNKWDLDAAVAALRTSAEDAISALNTTVENADLRLQELSFAASITAIHAAQLDRILMEERHKITLTNTLKFPFNSTLNSPVTIALDKVRDNVEYSVETEILSHDGPSGEIEITAKARNGFKISYSGSGNSLNLLVKIKGGMS